jgi:hypothetical protein
MGGIVNFAGAGRREPDRPSWTLLGIFLADFWPLEVRLGSTSWLMP